MQAPASVSVRVIKTDAEFAALEADWERLQSGAALTSIFQTFDWLHLWWTFYGRGRPLSVLVATAGQEPVGVLAVYVETVTIFHVPVRLLRFVGTGGDRRRTIWARCSGMAGRARWPARWRTPCWRSPPGMCCC